MTLTEAQRTPGLATLATDAFNLSPLGTVAGVGQLVVDAAAVVSRLVQGARSWVITTPYLGSSSAYADGKHHGVDVAAPLGSPIRAPLGGTIVAGPAGYDGPTTLGNGVYERLDDGTLLVFGHTVRGPLVPLGSRVEAGEQIAEVGSSGNSTGAHVHFQILPPGITNPLKDVDPLAWLVAKLTGTTAPAPVPAPTSPSSPGTTPPATTPGSAPATGVGTPTPTPTPTPTSPDAEASAGLGPVEVARLGPWALTIGLGWWLRLLLTCIAIIVIVYGLMKLADVDQLVLGAAKKAATGGVL